MIGLVTGFGRGTTPPAPAAPPMPRCAARDWLSGAACSLVDGHSEGHASEDEGFEIRWDRA